MINEKLLKDQPSTISYESSEVILNQMNKYICKIKRKMGVKELVSFVKYLSQTMKIYHLS